MKKVAINEQELAERWGLSPKTLQRWRSEGRGPRYLKLSKRVTYLVEEIQAFEMESMHSATWEKGSDVVLSQDPNLMSAGEIAKVMNLPMYILTHPNMRESLGIPFLHVGKLIRFKLDKINAWIYTTYREQTWSNVYQNWRTGFLHFLEVGEAVPETDLIAFELFPWMAGYSFTQVLIGSYNHHEEHRERIQEWFHENRTE